MTKGRRSIPTTAAGHLVFGHRARRVRRHPSRGAVEVGELLRENKVGLCESLGNI